MSCIPCPPSTGDEPLTCEPNESVTQANRLLVEDDSFCTKALAAPSGRASIVFDNGIVSWELQSETVWTAITSGYLASAGQKISANTGAGAFAITLPATPSQFDEIVFANHFNSWGSFNLTILRNGSLIEGISDDLVCNVTWPTQIILRFEGSTWRTYEII